MEIVMKQTKVHTLNLASTSYFSSKCSMGETHKVSSEWNEQFSVLWVLQKDHILSIEEQSVGESLQRVLRKTLIFEAITQIRVT